MHWTALSVGVLAIAVSLYCFLGIAYPFVSFYSDPVFGNFVLLIGGLVFGAFGCYLSWESVVSLEDRGIAKKINRKRRRKFGAVNARVS